PEKIIHCLESSLCAGRIVWYARAPQLFSSRALECNNSNRCIIVGIEHSVLNNDDRFWGRKRCGYSCGFWCLDRCAPLEIASFCVKRERNPICSDIHTPIVYSYIG